MVDTLHLWLQGEDNPPGDNGRTTPQQPDSRRGRAVERRGTHVGGQDGATRRPEDVTWDALLALHDASLRQGRALERGDAGAASAAFIAVLRHMATVVDVAAGSAILPVDESRWPNIELET